jgi:hypothetical protein
MSRNFGLVGVRLGDAQKDLNLQVSTQTPLDFDGKISWDGDGNADT